MLINFGIKKENKTHIRQKFLVQTINWLPLLHQDKQFNQEMVVDHKYKVVVELKEVVNKLNLLLD